MYMIAQRVYLGWKFFYFICKLELALFFYFLIPVLDPYVIFPFFLALLFPPLHLNSHFSNLWFAQYFGLEIPREFIIQVPVLI
jgi:hypothetical protein